VSLAVMWTTTPPFPHPQNSLFFPPPFSYPTKSQCNQSLKFHSFSMPSIVGDQFFQFYYSCRLSYKVACKKGQPLTHEDNPGNQTTWDIPRTSGTLESIVNHRIGKNCHKLVTKDALVPCFPKQSAMFGACEKGYPRRMESGAMVAARGPPTQLSGGKDSSVSASDTCPREMSVTFNSVTMGCPENTCSSGKQCTETTANDDRDSVSLRRSQVWLVFIWNKNTHQFIVCEY